MSETKIVVIGGGTGTYSVLTGLKQNKNILLSAIVTTGDSGGSTGRLRDEFGYLPVGDVRMTLTALASEDSEHELLLRELFNYRFSKGDGLSGHSFGNLLLVALTDILDSSSKAIAAATKILGAGGQVIPVAESPFDLEATYDDGTKLIGEHNIDEPAQDRYGQRIVELQTTSEVQISNTAKNAIASADLIVLGPGDLYTSLLANCIVPGVATALQQAPGKLLYNCNLMTKAGQTSNMNATDHFNEITKYIGRVPDFMLYNTTPLPTELISKYALEHEYPVLFEINANDAFIGRDLLATEAVKMTDGDMVKRSFLRHDPIKLATAILDTV